MSLLYIAIATATSLTYKIGQPKFRSLWERYCHGVDAIMYEVLFLRSCAIIEGFCIIVSFVVDSSDVRIDIAAQIIVCAEKSS